MARGAVRRRAARVVTPGQEVFAFDGPLIIHHTSSYDLQQAEEAAKNRNRRKGELALSPFAWKFGSAVKGLWIPHSRKENDAVIEVPRDVILQARVEARDRVTDHYLRTSDLPRKVIDVRAFYAGNRAAKQIFKEFKKFGTHARESYLRIGIALAPSGEVVREAFEESQMAYMGILDYLIALNYFVKTKNTNGHATGREWLHANHSQRYMAGHYIAADYLAGLNDEDFGKTVAEAYYSERSRFEYWSEFQVENKDHLHILERRMTRRLNTETPPIEAYWGDARDDVGNYVDDEYIG